MFLWGILQVDPKTIFRKLLCIIINLSKTAEADEERRSAGERRKAARQPETTLKTVDNSLNYKTSGDVCTVASAIEILRLNVVGFR